MVKENLQVIVLPLRVFTKICEKCGLKNLNKNKRAYGGHTKLIYTVNGATVEGKHHGTIQQS